MDSFSKWVMDKFGGNSVKEAIEKEVNRLIFETRQQKFPVKLSEIAKKIGINPIPIYQNQSSWGQLLEMNNEFRISLKIKSGKPPSIYWSGYPMLRYAYAHELIHSFFYTNKPPTRIAPIPKEKQEETLCNYGASFMLLPKSLLKEFLQNTDANIVSVAKELSAKSYVSLHSCFIRLINEDFFEEKINKLYILSTINEGYQNSGKRKPRCLISIIYNDEKKRKFFLPTYKGLDSISESWSLLNYHKNGYLNARVYVQNEYIEFGKNKYIINGKHELINSTYVWSDLHIQELQQWL